MSRTRHGERYPGIEYCARRWGNGCGYWPFTKKGMKQLTNRAERRIARLETTKEVRSIQPKAEYEEEERQFNQELNWSRCTCAGCLS